MLRLAREHEVLITIEEGAIGGFGSYVLQLLAERRRARPRPEGAHAWCCPTSSSITTSPNAMYAKAGLDAKGIVAKVFEALGREKIGAIKRA